MDDNLQRSMLARLLSKENISVQHGKYNTAFFDVKNRVLGLPIWKDRGKDVYDLLLGHEVGHALYTPADGWTKQLPCRMDYLNIVEDVRIEAIIQTTYPGLIGAFRRGYAELNSSDFFAIRDKDVQALEIGDRVNLKAKLGKQIDIVFSADEQPVVNQVMAVKTWEDTVAAAIALQKLAEKQQAEKNQNSEKTKVDQSNESNSDEMSSPLDMVPNGANEETKSLDKSTAGNDDKSSKDSQSQDNLSSDNSDKPELNDKLQSSQTDSSKTPAETGSQFDPNKSNSAPEITTQKAFNDSAKTLNDTSQSIKDTTYVIEPSIREIRSMVISNKQIAESRKSKIKTLLENHPTLAVPTYDSEYREFLASTKKFVSVLTKEFEMRKAAYQYNRSSVSKTGQLNLNRIHSYKYTDDIFLSVTKLADAKSHGMMMFVDYSASMANTLPFVLKHIINMCLFCKSTNIPFQVYGFTGSNNARPYVSDKDESQKTKDGEIAVSSDVILDLINSSMSKSDFANALKALFVQSSSKLQHEISKFEELGDTPLNETIIAAHLLVKEFKAKHNVQKMTTMFLTDGEPQHMQVRTKDEYIGHRTAASYGSRYDFVLNGRRVKGTKGINITSNLLKNLAVTTGTKTIGFFMPNSNQNALRYAAAALRSLLSETGLNGVFTKLEADKAKDYKKNKSISITGAFGYDEYFIVASGSNLNAEDDDFTIDNGMTRGRIAKVFSDFAKSKQINRVFVSKFAETIS